MGGPLPGPGSPRPLWQVADVKTDGLERRKERDKRVRLTPPLRPNQLRRHTSAERPPVHFITPNYSPVAEVFREEMDGEAERWSSSRLCSGCERTQTSAFAASAAVVSCE